jgi:glycosyltransferase involved in cell wall biosynthesis
MSSAAAVSAGNPYLAERALEAGATRVEMIPTVVDLSRYGVRALGMAEGKARIGWIGTPGTARLLSVIEDPLAAVVRDHGVTLTLVGVRSSPIPTVQIEPRPWSEETEVAEIQRFDLGIMPLPDEPFERGKCGYKLIQYMACGLPVVASPVGVNRDIVRHGINGFLASTQDEWRDALARLAADPGLRARMGAAGRRMVEEHYSLAVTVPRIAALLRSVVRD